MVIEDDNTGGDDRVKDLKAENARNAATRTGRLKDAEAAHEVYFADCILFVPYPFVVLCCVVLFFWFVVGDNPDVGAYACVVKQLVGQSDNSFQ